MAEHPTPAPRDATLPLERDLFLRTVLRELAGTLEDVVGLEDASGFVSVVGQRIGDDLDRQYRDALGVSALNRDQVGEVLVDLKRRIQGEFSLASATDDELVFVNARCPFGDKVLDRPALCMMTSNVFGSIAAQNLGYAKVVLEETIARGHAGCRVVVHLRSTDASRQRDGREYFGH